MPCGTTEPGRYRRWIAVAATILITGSVTGYAAVAAIATATVGAARAGGLLADRAVDKRNLLAALATGQVATALAARPLDPRLVNVAMVRAADRGAAVAPWMAVLSRLGWRDTTALQNRLYFAAVRSDVANAFNIADALLRRRQLTEQMLPLLTTVESDPPSRTILVDRLAARPNWRGLYLTTTGSLHSPAELTGRYALLRALQRRGSPIELSEALPNVRAFEQAGLHELGFGLWRSMRPQGTRPLDDTRFAAVGESFRQGSDDPVAYQWEIPNGEGFRADAVADGGRATLDIDWSGRGVPVFAQQRTSIEPSAVPARYMLQVGVAPANVADLAAFDFRLVCDAGTLSLQQDLHAPRRFVTLTSVPCAYPIFQIAGNIQAAATPRHLSILSLTLRPLVSRAQPRTRNPG